MSSKRKWVLIRSNYGNCMKGMLFDSIGNFICNILELPWLSNIRSRSSIPNGTYNLKLIQSARFKRYLIEVDNVLNRDYILIHAGNYLTDTEGCLLCGDSFVTGQAVINHSIRALDRVMKVYRSDVPDCIEIVTKDNVNVLNYSSNYKKKLSDIA